MLKLYTYFRSSAAYRVRIALNLKGLPYEALPVHLLRNGGEQRSDAYRSRNPQGLIPFLDTEAGGVGQSLAILEYLEELTPTPALLPSEPLKRAQVRAFAQHIACDIHPLNNLRVLQYLTGTLGISEDAKLAWIRHWLAEGFRGLEAEVAQRNPSGPYCFGEQLTFADVCLVPQWFNAERFQCDLTPYPRLAAAVKACNELPAFQSAHPSRQPDSE
ncbi:maleylacetoacetate isomerase [Permianibacter fluminis]|uniref:maleylacetoacetate isomerase n=1 Tax=Permianibacter fluminis TaxID=2738515 RepID=UPI0038B3771D